MINIMYKDSLIYESGDDEWLESVDFLGISEFHFMGGISDKKDIEKYGLAFDCLQTEKEFEDNLKK
jgi:hypothetical protein